MMKTRFFPWAVAGFLLISCVQPNHEQHSANEHEHEAVSVKYTVYSDDFELFAEADPLVCSDTARILAHFTSLSDFKPLLEGRVKLTLFINQKEFTDIQEKPVRPGIYLFHLAPGITGLGSVKFDIDRADGHFTILVPEVSVYSDEEKAHQEIEDQHESAVNATVFTKEQSWKIDFQTSLPDTGKFGQVIKTTALVEALPENETYISAQTSGFVVLPGMPVLEGALVKKGQVLLTISGNNLSENNIQLKYQEAKSKYELSKADYERANQLFQEKIISEKVFQTSRNAYEIARSQYDNLNKSIGKDGQTALSPVSGFVRQVFVQNGSYVEAGEKLMLLTKDNELLLKAEIPQRYYSLIQSIQSAVIKAPTEPNPFTWEQLNGKVLSIGKAANSETYQLPVNLQVTNPGSLVPGSFVELYLKAAGDVSTMFIPATALLEEQGLFFVWVQQNPELFEKREVVIGMNDGINYEIKRGILPGERIVTKGAMMIKLSQATGTLDAHSGHVH